MAVVSVSASYGSSTASQTATLTVNPATLLSVSVDPSTLSGGATSSGTVTLTGAAPAGGFAIKLSSNSASATVPASVSIPAGKTSVIFSVKTVPVKSVTTAAITATLGGVSQAATLTIQPPSLESVTLKPATVIGLTASVGTITLSGPAATGGMVVALTSSSTAAVVPVSVTIAAGKSSATFTVKTTSVAAQTVATISAALNGDQVSSELTISPPAVTALVLSPASVVGGKTSTGTVTLGTAAPVGGISVKLGSGSVSASVQANVVVPAGKTSAKFTITTSVVTGKTVAAITATLGASSKSANLTITK